MRAQIFLISLLVLGAVLAISGCTDSSIVGAYNLDESAPAISPGKVVNINAQSAKELIDSGSVFLVDVRTPEEFNESHIDGAILRPLQELENPQMLETIIETLPKDKPILVYCRSGRRSAVASNILIKSGFVVYNLEGGIIEWEKARYETVSLIK